MGEFFFQRIIYLSMHTSSSGKKAYVIYFYNFLHLNHKRYWFFQLRIPYKDIISLTREKSALVIPNAIKLQTKDQNEYLFASYIPREKMFVSILRIWQNALLDQVSVYFSDKEKSNLLRFLLSLAIKLWWITSIDSCRSTKSSWI